MTETYHQFEHEKYEELCALATAGALTPHESEILLVHLNVCAECSLIFEQYETLATDGIPALAQEFASTAEGARFDGPSALERLLETADNKRPLPLPVPVHSQSWFRQPAWQGLIAASVLVAVSVGFYRLGELKSGAAAAVASSPAPSPQLQQIAAEKLSLTADLAADNRRLAELQKESESSKVEQDKLRAEASNAQEKLDSLNAELSDSKSQSAAQLAALTQDRDAVLAKLQSAQESYQAVQYELDNLRSLHKKDLLQLASLQDRVTGLNAVLDESDRKTKDDEQYLASDKDIRDLIGARNLYIADIMDVNEDGSSKKPFGRVFYTKTKSLVFYAYDLDRQQGVKQASTFQVWGRSGASDRKPVNLGMLYMDSASNKRWTLRVDNPQQLSQLEAIFVTVEPKPRSGDQPERPTGKPFLYASLRRDANHP
jgi:hypothetical protein